MNDRLTRRATIVSVLLVALVAAIVSYAHMHDLAQLHGEAWRATLIPLAVDGMLVAATLAIVSQRRHRHKAGWVPWLGLTLGIGASLAANVAAARPELIAQLIAAWPPVALAVSIETLVVVLRGAQSYAPEGVSMDTPSGLDWSQPNADSNQAEPGSSPTTDDVPGQENVSMGTLPGELPGREVCIHGYRPVSDPGQLDVSMDTSTDPVAELLAQGAGRRKLAAELNISEHEARKLLAASKNGSSDVQA